MISNGPAFEHLRSSGMVVGISAGLEEFKEKTTRSAVVDTTGENRHEQRKRRRVAGELGKRACRS